ncbi:hypothetical protein [Paenibacillus hubeiensis]|uniref:hypothetical protein n=1 Tax=Paenibacillus hubeiensis TaxID=3077330 RepID=UPI0031BAD922
MGKYVSVRGWLECDEQTVHEVRKIRDDYTEKYNDTLLDKSKLEMYQSGWTFPETQINWTAYVFYGADIREYYLDFMRKQLSEMAAISDITGYFLIDDHDGEKNLCWQISGHKLIKNEQENITFNK